MAEKSMEDLFRDVGCGDAQINAIKEGLGVVARSTDRAKSVVQSFVTVFEETVADIKESHQRSKEPGKSE